MLEKIKKKFEEFKKEFPLVMGAFWAVGKYLTIQSFTYLRSRLPYLAVGFFLGFGVYTWSHLSKPLEETIVLNDKLHGKIVRTGFAPLVRLRTGGGWCSGYVADSKYIITASHCIRDKKGRLSKVDVRIFDKNNRVIATGKPAAISKQIDIGLIHGDFSKFKVLPSNFYDAMFQANDSMFISCGFPEGQRKPTCAKFFPGSSIVLSSPLLGGGLGMGIDGNGTMLPGMSGGPIMEINSGEVVGINVGVTTRGVFAASLIGLLGRFNIEP